MDAIDVVNATPAAYRISFDDLSIADTILDHLETLLK